MAQLIDPDMPSSAAARTGFDGLPYELVFSDEFNTANRTFWPGDDPFWEAVNIRHGSTGDQGWYGPAQITTRGGYLSIVIDQMPKNDLPYRSGMLQSWNKFCFTGGYIDCGVEHASQQDGRMHGRWVILHARDAARLQAAYGLTPMTCDVGTFPNQAERDGSGPAAALQSNALKTKYNYELSWLPGQRLSEVIPDFFSSICFCICPSLRAHIPTIHAQHWTRTPLALYPGHAPAPGEDHPGPSVNVGRGAPEIDILEVEHNKDAWFINTPSITDVNPFLGVPCFECRSDSSNPADGYITWQTAGVESARVGAAALSPDPLPDGTDVSQRLISVEPMVCLRLSPRHSAWRIHSTSPLSSTWAGWQTVHLSAMIFPAGMLVDYVRAYGEGRRMLGAARQTTLQMAISTDIWIHPNLTSWNYLIPQNSLVRRP
ncbi:glycoside hydrolase family 16 protein [Suillus plorans]|uniref:Glycoside hydrolase family 16 protein n=1 Tax=Suillus plorans TaxID=116603 RepID=A0A9P7ASU8_9AGAM|nr:glycoside hydrolase family 16 protein [Suillus plorans]KAG1795944.1 glycoside hydrolase family 16 protein [Suillus plorans]